MEQIDRGMKKVYTWIGLGILCGCLLLVLQYLQTNEPFLANNQCPAGFTFFTDLKGSSFCCKGRVKDKKCMATGKNTFCGLAPNLIDPRTNIPLPTCTKLMDEIASSTSGKYCVKEMPNYIAPGRTEHGGCSVAPAAGDGSDFPTGPDRNRWATPYCMISGKENFFELAADNRTNEVFNCETLKLKESVKCPKGLYAAQDPVNQGGMVYCKSSTPYDQKTGDPKFCIPDEQFALFPNRETGKLLGLEFAKTICMSCSHYKKRWVNKDTTAKCVN